MIEKFECSKCGKCCKDFDGGIKQTIPSFNGDVFQVNKIYLGLFEWEKEIFENRGVKVIIGEVVYDLKRNISIVLSYTTTENMCALLTKDNKCSIYEERPLMCKIFPCPYGELKLRKPKETINTLCSKELPKEALNSLLGFENVEGDILRIKASEIRKKLEERYNNSFYAHFLFDVIKDTRGRLLIELEKEGKIKIAKNGYNPIFLLKRINNNVSLSFSDFYLTEENKDFASNFIQFKTDEEIKGFVKEVFLNKLKDND